MEGIRADNEEPGTWHVFPSGFAMECRAAAKLIRVALERVRNGQTTWAKQPRQAGARFGGVTFDFGSDLNDLVDAMRYAAQASYPPDAFDDVHDWEAKTIRSRHERRNRDFPNASPEYKAAAEAAQKKDPPPPGTPLFVNPQTGEFKW